jgi:hypothetical protein
MRLPFALSSVSGLSRHTLFSAGFTTNMFGFEFSVHTVLDIEGGGGTRTKEDLPFFGWLHKLPKDFIGVNLAFSRTPGQPKRYVQDLMRQRAADLAALLTDPDSYFYVCSLWKKASCWRCARSARKPACAGRRSEQPSSATADCTWRRPKRQTRRC